jgi:nucleotide-binding universal stress UspA family protein
MERILVGTSPRHGAFAALPRAISLAKRIKAKVFLLYVAPSRDGEHADASPTVEADDHGRLRLMVQKGQEDGVGIEYFVTEGGYEEEVIRFARDRKITLLVSESADGEGRNSERDAQSLQRILHGISCRVELVSPRGDQTATQGTGSVK